MKTHLTVVLSFLLLSTYSFSQLVTPSDRVISRLNVRDMPSGNMIGSLEPGETAPLITDTIPYWYMILYNANTGYVHKSWSEIIPIAKESLVIGSLNIKWFGSATNDRHDYEEMANIIQEMDVLAIQEVKGDRYLDRLDTLVAVLARRGLNYEYVCSEETGYDNNPGENMNDYVERYAYLWDHDRVELLHPDTPYYFISEPIINNPTFRAVPIVSDFKVKSDEGFDFRIATIHTVYKHEIEHVRGAEILFLHNWMNDQVFDLEVDEKDVFIIGDFNANPDGQTAYFNSIITDTTGYRVIFNEPLIAGEDSKRTTILKKQHVTANDHILPAYDHLLMSKHTTYAISVYPITWTSGVIGVVEFDQEPKFQAMENRFEIIAAMSDHRPIWIKIPYDTEDRD